MTALDFAQQLGITPWDALLTAVRRASSWAQWYEMKLRTVEDDEEMRPGGAAWDWVKGLEDATAAQARYAKMAIDAGVAERLVRQVEVEAQVIAHVLNRVLDDLPLSVEDQGRARRLVVMELEQLELEQLPGGVS